MYNSRCTDSDVQYRGFTIEIHQDEDPLDPRGWDNLGTMVCWSLYYHFGDKHDFSTPDDFREWMKEQEEAGEIFYILPIIKYEHSGVWLSTSNRGWPFNCPWDAGQIGWIYVTMSKVLKEYKWRKMNEKREEKILGYLRQEISTYSDYISGDVYGFVVKDASGETVDSCWGFYGEFKDSKIFEEAKSVVDHEIKCLLKRSQAKLKELIQHKVDFAVRQEKMSEIMAPLNIYQIAVR